MSRVRSITRRLPQNQKNYYVIDCNFLVNKYIPLDIVPSNEKKEKDRIDKCKIWWMEIDNQLKRKQARVYIPAACVAEAFKVLAKRCFHPNEKWFKSGQQYNYWRRKLSKDISMSNRDLRGFKRNIKYHDIAMSRDIIISVDRFYELFSKYKKSVNIIDLTLVASAKYLMDFFDLPKENLHIITLDKPLREGIQKLQDLPNAYDPTLISHSVRRIFV